MIGIEERPVPQEPRQATALTQPYPIGDAIVPQSIDIPPEGSSITPDGAELINRGRIFTPFWTDPIFVKPASMGGANWPPSAYDPETHRLYVCATDRINSFVVDPDLDDPSVNEVYMGGRFTQPGVDDRGIFAALDVTTNRLVWRQQWPEICYSGAVVTAGGLVFVGRSDGRLTALDKRNGKLLWEYQTDAGVNTTVTTFEHNGEQMVVVHAGGGVFPAAKRGDGIWMFSLEGTMKSLPAGAGTQDAPAPAGAAAAARAPDPAHGAEVYREACIACHGEDGAGGRGGGPSLVDGLDPRSMRAIAGAGRNNMPAFGGVYSGADLDDVVAYIVDELASD